MALAMGLFSVLFVGVIAGIITWRHFQTEPFESAVGCPLPAAATDLRAVSSSGFDGGEYYASAKISELDFLRLMQTLRLERHPAILRGYPGTLEPNLDWWPKTPTRDEDTFFGLRPDANHDRYIAAEYENGRFYLRRSMW